MASSPRVGVLAVASASPEHRTTQADAKLFARSFFTGTPDQARHATGTPDEAALERLLAAYDNAGVETRWLGRPLEWLTQRRSLPRKNAAYVEQALLLSQRCASAAIEKSGIARSELGAIVFASSTGISTPSLDARLVQTLDLPRDIARVPLWGLGCAGGGAGLARARALAIGLDKPVLLIACELCSLTFVHGDRRSANVIAVALFGDGAAATVVAPEPWWQPERGPELLANFSRLLDDSEALMGWDVEDEGLRVRFSPAIPDVVLELGVQLFEDAAALIDRKAADFRHLLFHPGGRRVLDVYEKMLGLDAESGAGPDSGRLRHSRAVLREHGNMSSPTVLFVLERFLADTPASGEPGLLLSLGPGFCAEGVVFRW
jgi:alkylresorcinol/alkylpyrone synthase